MMTKLEDGGWEDWPFVSGIRVSLTLLSYSVLCLAPIVLTLALTIGMAAGGECRIPRSCARRYPKDVITAMDSRTKIRVEVFSSSLARSNRGTVVAQADSIYKV